MNFDGITIIDDDKDKFEIIREIIKNNDQEDAFYLFDIGDVIHKHRNWISKIPRIKPHYAIKCNSDERMIKTLAALNANFDCASKHEIEQVLSTGVSSERIIFANTAKLPSHIKFARDVGVEILTVDSEFEMCKIKDIYPDAKIVIRFRCDGSKVGTFLGSKFGCDPASQGPKLIRKSKELGMNLHGFSFHTGGQCEEIAAWIRGIKMALGLIDFAKCLGFHNVKLIDIGGGFPGNNSHLMDMITDSLNEVLDDIDPSIKVISEPGRYYIASAFTLATFIHSKRIVDDVKNGSTRYMYHINDGTFGSFGQVTLGRSTPIPSTLNKPANEETLHPSTIWGPTCDGVDCVVPDFDIPELNIGDWLVWADMGAYTKSGAGNFNGIFPPVVLPFIRSNERFLFNDEKDGVLNKEENE